MFNPNVLFIKGYLSKLSDPNEGQLLTLAASRPYYPAQKLFYHDVIASAIIDDIVKVQDLNARRNRLLYLLNLLYSGMYDGEDRVRFMQNLKNIYNVENDEELNNYLKDLSNTDKFMIYMGLEPQFVPRRYDESTMIGIISSLLGIRPRKTIYEFRFGESERSDNRPTEQNR